MSNKIFSSILVFVLCFAMVACTVDQVLGDLQVLTTAAQAVCPAVVFVSPIDSAACSVVSAVASTGIATIQTAYDTYKASGAATDLQKVEAAINAINTNLPAELAAAHIVSPRAVALVTAWVKLTTGTLNVVLGLLPQFKVATTAQARAAIVLPPTLSPQVIQARWANDVCLGEPRCSSLVVYHQHSKVVRILTLGIMK